MLDNNIKISKLNSVQTATATASNSTSLSYLSKQMQILNTEIATVIAIAEDGDAIFTTLAGNTIKSLNGLNVTIGDKIRIEKVNESTYSIVSIVEKTLLGINKSSVSDIVAVNPYHQNDLINEGIESSRLNVKQIISGTFTNIDNDADMFNEEFATKPSQQYVINKNYNFKIISIADQINESVDQAAFEMGVVGTLNEILSDDKEPDNAFAAKVIGVNSSGTILKTVFGTIILDKAYALNTGVNLILKIEEEPFSNNEIYNTTSKANIESLMQNLQSIQNIIGNTLNHLNTDSISKMLGWIALALAKGSREEKKEINLDSLAKNLPLTQSPLEDKDEMANLVDSFRGAQEELKNISNKKFPEIENGMWFFANIPVHVEEKLHKPKLYIYKVDKTVIRLISEISLSKIGDLQLDCIIKLKNMRGISRPLIEKIELSLKHKNTLPDEFFKKIQESFHETTKYLEIDSKIIFEKTNDFYKSNTPKPPKEVRLQDLENSWNVIV